MNILFRLTIFITLTTTMLAATSCATLTDDIEVASHANPDVDYQAYKTYAWLGSAQIIFDPVGQWEQPTLDTDEEVKYVINRELRAHGLHQVTNKPDLLVAYAAGIDTTLLELKENPDNTKKVVTDVPKAALLIALIDAHSGYTVWLGYAVGEAQQQQSIESIRTRIDYAVKEIFSDY